MKTIFLMHLGIVHPNFEVATYGDIFSAKIVSVFCAQKNQHLIVAKLDDLDDTKFYKT